MPTPLARFVNLEYDQLKVEDVKDLLDDYKRLAKALREVADE